MVQKIIKVSVLVTFGFKIVNGMSGQHLKYFILKTVINCLDTSPPITKLVFLEMLPPDFMNLNRLISTL